MKKKKKFISDEDIEKAVDELDEDEFEEGEDEEVNDDEEEEEEESTEEETEEEDDEDDDDDDEEVEAATDDEIMDDDDDDDDEEEKKPSKKSSKGDKKGAKNNKKPIKKAAGSSKKKKTTTIEKSFKGHNLDVVEAVNVSNFIKGIVDDNDKRLNDNEQLLKGVTLKLVKGFISMRDELAEIKNMLNVPKGKKSTDTIKKGINVKKRNFKKSFDDEDNPEEENGTTIGLRSGRRTIVKALDDLTFKDNKVDQSYADALRKFEGTGEISKSVLNDVEKHLDCKIDIEQ